MTSRNFLLIMFLVILTSSSSLNAQSVTVFGAGIYAKDCFQEAKKASLNLTLGRSSLDKCTLALDHGKLKIRDRAATYVNRGVVRVNLKQYTEALQDYNHAAGLRPDLTAIYVNRGNVYYLTREFDEAINEYSKSLAMNTHAAPVAYVNRGMSHEKLGLYKEATEDYRNAIELAPQWEVAKEKLAKLSARQHK